MGSRFRFRHNLHLLDFDFFKNQHLDAPLSIDEIVGYWFLE